MLRILALATFLSASLAAVQAGELHKALLYKNPQCSCCEGYADYLRQNGFDVEVKPTNDLAEISSKAGVPADFQGCHTMFIDGYVVDAAASALAVCGRQNKANAEADTRAARVWLRISDKVNAS